MKTILVINDNSPGVMNAAKLAFFIACKMHANLILANTLKLDNSITEKAIAGNICCRQKDSLVTDLAEYSGTLNDRPNDFEPAINEMDTSAMGEDQLVQMINQRDIWMIVKGTTDRLPEGAHGNLNFNSILNKVRCPLLLIPETWTLKNIERLVYITDLRYCRLQIVQYLARLAKLWHADLSITHLTKKGITHMDEDYANKVFNDGVRKNVNYDRLFFNNTRERNLTTAVDVLINGMHNDLLVMTKNRFHYNEIIGPYITNSLPSYITVPLLIFPS